MSCLGVDKISAEGKQTEDVGRHYSEENIST